MRSIKYGNKPKIILGVKFHSTKEANRYLDLLLLIKSGEISDLELQVSYPIFINDKKVFKYIADFVYLENGNKIVEDVKGYKTAIYRIKKKCVEAYYNIKIREI